MKKFLFATTAFIATAGMASAEISFSGYGRFGVKSTDNETTNGFDGLDAKSQIDKAQEAQDAEKTADMAVGEAQTAFDAASDAAARSKAAAAAAATRSKDVALQAAIAGLTVAGFEGFTGMADDDSDNENIVMVARKTAATKLAYDTRQNLADDATEVDTQDANEALGKAFAEAVRVGGLSKEVLTRDRELETYTEADAALTALPEGTDAEGRSVAQANVDNAAIALGAALISSLASAGDDDADVSEFLGDTRNADTVLNAHDVAIVAADEVKTAVDDAADEMVDKAETDRTTATAAAAAAATAAATAKASAQSALDNMLLAGLGAGSNDDSEDVTARYRVNLDIINETDNGLKFEGRVRLQGDNGSSATLNAPRFSVSTAGFRLDVGNVSGAIDNLSNYYGYEPGLTALVGQYTGVNFAFDAYSSTGTGEKNAFAASYGAGNFSAQISYSDDGSGGNDYGSVLGDSEQIGVNVAWAMDALTFAAGYATASQKLESGLASAVSNLGLTAPKNGYDSSMYALTAAADLGDDLGLTVLLGSEDHDADPDGLYFDTFYGLSAQYQIGAATALQFSYGDGSAEFDTQSLGFGVTHDLGGAVLKAGIARSKIEGESNGRKLSSEDTNFDFGVTFNF